MRLYIFCCGRIRATGGPVRPYLVRTGTADVLIDTGYARDRAGAHRDDPRERIELEPGEDVVSRLGRLGVAPDDVDLLVTTHFDPDHAGNHDAFPGARIVVQRAHLDWARAGGSPRPALTRERWDRPDPDAYRVVDGDAELLPGVELVESGGHVPGHQSVLVRLPSTGPVLLAADAIPTAEAADARTRPIYPFDMAEDAVRASTRKLVELARAENAMVVYGHDPGYARTLRTAPAYYD